MTLDDAINQSVDGVAVRDRPGELLVGVNGNGVFVPLRITADRVEINPAAAVCLNDGAEDWEPVDVVEGFDRPRAALAAPVDIFEQHPGLRAASRKLYDRWKSGLGRPDYWLVSIGIQENAGRIVVYTRTDARPVPIPAEIDGFPIDVRVMGSISVGGAGG